jgi:ABC-2 type transport system permease protein
MNTRRIGALYIRQAYVVVRSFPRLIDMTLLPVVDLLLWGLVTTYLRGRHVQIARPLTFLLGGLLLWDIVFRTKNQVAVAFLEEQWSHHVIVMLSSPVTPSEYVAASVLWGLTAVAVGWSLIAFLAWTLFHFGVATIGVSLVGYGFALIVFGIGLALVVVGMLLRFGFDADIMAWALGFLVLPFSAVYYPLASLPRWAQTVATALPTSHVFEAMRTILAGGSAPLGQLWIALSLDVVWLAVGFGFARWMFATLRRRGYVTRYV